MPRGRPRRPVEPLLERLAEGKVPKQIGAELGICGEAVCLILRRHLRETGCRTIIQAVVKHVKKGG